MGPDLRTLRAFGTALGPGAQLHVVGGALRDRLLEREVGDLDLATALSPENVMARARAAGCRVIPTGLRHGTVTVILDGHPLEITTFRGDGDYRDGRRPESVRLGVSLREDLARRDFTINAMALPLESLDAPDWREALVDPFRGVEDLAARCLRAVGDPRVRFAEDGLRPLRACRFASQLDFEIEAATREAIPERLEVCAKVAVERVQVELAKLLLGGAPARGLRELERTRLLDLWLPELRRLVGLGQNAHHAHDAWEHTLAVVEASPREPGLRWAALLHDLGKAATRSVGPDGRVHFYGHEVHSLDQAEAVLGRLRVAHALRDETLALIRHHGIHPDGAWSPAACRRFLRRLAEDRLDLETWAAFRRADQAGKGVAVEERLAAHDALLARLRDIRASAPPLRIQELALPATELRRLAGRAPGPWLGALQRHLLDLVIDEPEANTDACLHEAAIRWLARENP